MGESFNRKQIAVGVCLLFLGILYYCLFRTADHTYFLQFFRITPNLKEASSGIFLTLGQSLPTFLHVFAFSLLTAGLIASSWKGYAAICFFWFGINVLFELGQKFDRRFIQIIPDWFSNIAFLENTENYFLKGRFDCLDLFSITLGAFVAYIFLIKTTKRGKGNEKQAIACG